MEAALFGTLVSATVSLLHLRQRKRANVRIPDLRLYNQKVQRLRSGKDKVQIIIDFDRTITTYFHAPGEKGASCHGIVEHLWDGPRKAKAVALNDYYYPIEVSPERTQEEKVPFMVDWYNSINELIIGSGLTQDQLVQQVAAAPVKLRPGVQELFNWADAHGVPVTVFSAGITNVAEEVLRQKWRNPLPPLVKVVSNAMLFEGPGGAITGFAQPLVHMFNKTPACLANVPGAAEWHRIMQGRPNVLLIGDGLGDAAMADGLHPGMRSRPRKAVAAEAGSAAAGAGRAPGSVVAASPAKAPQSPSAAGARTPRGRGFSTGAATPSGSSSPSKEERERHTAAVIEEALAPRAELHVLRVGLCNVNVDKLLPAYEEVYDLVITEDGPLDEVVALVRQIEEEGQRQGVAGTSSRSGSPARARVGERAAVSPAQVMALLEGQRDLRAALAAAVSAGTDSSPSRQAQQQQGSSG